MPTPRPFGRSSIRFEGYDYSSPGAYFLTLCVCDRLPLFGRIENSEMKLNDAGRMVNEVWLSLPERHPHAAIDAHCVMPNHFHGIVFLRGSGMQGGADSSGSLVDLVHWFKLRTAHQYREGVHHHGWSPYNGRLWQRNYFEHIICSERAMGAIQDYILGNPAMWTRDKENSERVQDDDGTKPCEDWQV